MEQVKCKVKERNGQTGEWRLSGSLKRLAGMGQEAAGINGYEEQVWGEEQDWPMWMNENDPAEELNQIKPEINNKKLQINRLDPFACR